MVIHERWRHSLVLDSMKENSHMGLRIGILRPRHFKIETFEK